MWGKVSCLRKQHDVREPPTFQLSLFMSYAINVAIFKIPPSPSSPHFSNPPILLHFISYLLLADQAGPISSKLVVSF